MSKKFIFLILLSIFAGLSDFSFGASLSGEDIQEQLFNAAFRGEVKVIDQLKSRGVDVNMVDNRGGDGNSQTALTYAVAGNQFKMVDHLLSLGATFYPSVLAVAVSRSNIRMVRRLLEKGANPNASNIHDWTPLMSACSRGDINIVHLLLKSGAKVNASSQLGYTPLLAAVENGNKNIVQLLLEQDVDIHASVRSGQTALDIAKEKGFKDIEALLSNDK